ncbi:hypothetical protein DCAR_0520397 [Daucus carota subsp. sativus]|uniref:Uncharacterized protein n=1 Tax=Daucus carota subsp. sativus TaxID=79200 RepID=A0A164YIB1_DAUCS|nr:hypothetical protein DCAR_0520397 [Daucus carota subsp. sativus]
MYTVNHIQYQFLLLKSENVAISPKQHRNKRESTVHIKAKASYHFMLCLITEQQYLNLYRAGQFSTNTQHT